MPGLAINVYKKQKLAFFFRLVRDPDNTNKSDRSAIADQFEGIDEAGLTLFAIRYTVRAVARINSLTEERNSSL